MNRVCRLVKLKEGRPAIEDRKGNAARGKERRAVVGREDVGGAVRACFAEQGQVLLPMLELIETARTSIDELMSEAAHGFVEKRDRRAVR